MPGFARQLALGIVLVSLALPARAALTWRPGEGWAYENENTPAQASNSRVQIELAKSLEDQEDYKAAIGAYAALVRTWPFSFNAGEAQFKVGWCGEKLGAFPRAFEAYQRCVEKYPNSEFFDDALERQFAIANLYLAGEPQRIWAIPFLPSMDKTVKMYEQIIKNASHGRFAVESQFKIGLAREKQKKWTEAVRAYVTILNRYPNNDLVDDAQYQIGYVWFQASQSADYDQAAGDKAVSAFKEFLDRFPDSDKVQQARDNLDELQGRSVRGAFNIAKFYEGQRKYQAAIIYYNEVIQKGPKSREADVAREKIKQLKPEQSEAELQAQQSADKKARKAQLVAAAGTNGALPEIESPDPAPAPIDPALANRNAPPNLGKIAPPAAKPAPAEVPASDVARRQAEDAEIAALQAERAAAAAEARLIAAQENRGRRGNKKAQQQEILQVPSAEVGPVPDSAFPDLASSDSPENQAAPETSQAKPSRRPLDQRGNQAR